MLRENLPPRILYSTKSSTREQTVSDKQNLREILPLGNPNEKPTKSYCSEIKPKQRNVMQKTRVSKISVRE